MNQWGFGNYFQTEAIKGALPQNQNSPQKCFQGLYAELVSGNAFTALKDSQRRSWLYRISPRAKFNKNFECVNHCSFGEISYGATPPHPLRFDPLPDSSRPSSFIDGLKLIVNCGGELENSGGKIYLYGFDKQKENELFEFSDSEILLIPHTGDIKLTTELGKLTISPGEIGVIPKGIIFSVLGNSSGYFFENFGASFELPYRGPIGSSGLANERDFEYPVASYEDKKGTYAFYKKFGGNLFKCQLDESPFDVVAWHGNHAPYKYDLFKFNTMGSISYDHPDPSIFTVLTSPSSTPGVANFDFVIFSPRWLVAKNSFRPPYFHRNIMSEFMGNIHGVYDAKKGTGFSKGASSIHNRFVPHGPERDVYEKESTKSLDPEYLDNTMSFMLESSHFMQVTNEMQNSPLLQKNYNNCWNNLNKNFKE